MNGLTIFLFMVVSQAVGYSTPHHGRPFQVVAALIAGAIAAAVGGGTLTLVGRSRRRHKVASSDSSSALP
jgi:predicted membrane-bound mannosyltransferase